MKKVEKINRFLNGILNITGSVALVTLIVRWGIHIEHIGPELFTMIELGVFIVFVFAVIIRFLIASLKKGYLKTYWMDLLVLIPVTQFFVYGGRSACLFIVIRQGILVASKLFKSEMIKRIISLLSLKPAQLLMLSFLMTILVGAFLLTLPVATQDGSGATFIDALFTATSATCVTGLIVQDTGTFFSMFGQLIILLLIQVGALGIMTFSITLFMAVGKKVSHKERIAMQEVLDQDSVADVVGVIKFIAKMTLFAELWGAVFLYFSFMPYIDDPVFRAYAAIFHSISAFCNAGFSIFPDSLMQYASDVNINLCISFLIIFGGLGFIVVKDIWSKFARKNRARSIGLRLHTKIVLSVSAILLIVGTIAIFIAEYNFGLQGMPLKDKILISFFQSTSARTAGFNTMDIGAMRHGSIFAMIILMFIGASAGSTGGGIKTTTFWMIWKAFTSHMKNKEHISAFRRKLPDAALGKAITVLVLSSVLVISFTFLISLFETLPFRDMFFEVVSAFGTVGLSCGITGQMHMPGKILITILMFLGRLGPLTAVLAFSQYRRKINYTYAEEKIMIG